MTQNCLNYITLQKEFDLWQESGKGKVLFQLGYANLSLLLETYSKVVTLSHFS